MKKLTNKKDMNFLEFNAKFPTEESIIDYYIQKRYSKEKPKCNHCGCENVYSYKNEKLKKFFRCGGCGRDFSIFKGTIFEKSDTDLRKWFYAIHLFLNGKKGISALQLQREISVTYKTAWRILHKIREAMGNNDDDNNGGGNLSGIVEIDEAYIGGSETNKHVENKFTKTKSIVLGMLERKGKVKAFHIEDATYPNIAEKVLTNVEIGSTINTDKHKSYVMLKTYYNHKSVNHSKKEFRKGDAYINSIEGFWATFKRGIYGVYHHISKKYTQHYINEFTFRFNHRENEEIFEKLIINTIL